MSNNNSSEALAEIVDSAAFNVNPIDQLSKNTNISIEDAYAIQKASIQRRLNRGESLIGLKMGFTSRAKMIQMNVDDLIFGHLTDTMLLEEGGILDINSFIHPRIEPEIAFILKKNLSGKISLSEALSAVECVMPAMEVIDSRYKNFKFSLEDVVADNSSSSGVILGQAYSPLMDITNLGMVLKLNEKPVEIGSTAAILGNPLRSLVSAARLAEQYEIELQAGWMIMAGAATAATSIPRKTRISCTVEKMGNVTIQSN